MRIGVLDIEHLEEEDNIKICNLISTGGPILSSFAKAQASKGGLSREKIRDCEHDSLKTSQQFTSTIDKVQREYTELHKIAEQEFKDSQESNRLESDIQNALDNIKVGKFMGKTKPKSKTLKESKSSTNHINKKGEQKKMNDQSKPEDINNKATSGLPIPNPIDTNPITEDLSPKNKTKLTDIPLPPLNKSNDDGKTESEANVVLIENKVTLTTETKISSRDGSPSRTTGENTTSQEVSFLAAPEVFPPVSDMIKMQLADNSRMMTNFGQVTKTILEDIQIYPIGDKNAVEGATGGEDHEWVTEDQYHEENEDELYGYDSETEDQGGFDIFNEPEEKDIKIPTEKKKPSKQTRDKGKHHKETKGGKENTRTSIREFEADREIFSPENVHKWDDESLLGNLIDTILSVGVTPSPSIYCSTNNQKSG